MSFTAAFGGDKYTFIQATGSATSSWQQMGTWTVNGSGIPSLTIAKSHTGGFGRSQTGTYNITVTNNGSLPASGAVTLTDLLPTGLTPAAMSGPGWSCTPPGGPCTRSDSLAIGSSYPPITFTVNVAADASGTVTNQANVSGGGSASGTATDATTIGGCGSLATMTSPLNGATLSGSTVTFNWCTAPGNPQYYLYVGTTGFGSYDILTQNEDSSTSQTVTNIPASGSVYVRLYTNVSGGWQYVDYTYSTSCGTGCAPALTIAKSHLGDFTQGQSGTYTITVGNSGSAAAASGTVTVNDALPSGLTPAAISGPGWSCTSPGGPCTRSDALAAGNSYPDITFTVNVPGAPGTVTNSANITGGASITDSTNIVTSGSCGGSTTAIMTSAVQSGSTATFTWCAVSGTPPYHLYVGTQPGLYDVFIQSESGTSQAVSVPASGTIYVRLWTQVNVAWQYNDYTFPLPIVSTENISTPSVSGGAGGAPGTSYPYTASGAVSSLGHQLQYLFTWGDGTSSTWATSAGASHAWTAVGTYNVAVQARCAVDTGIVSLFSSPMAVTVTLVSAATPTFNPAAGTYSSPQTVSITTATPGASIRYTTNGSTPSETAGTLYAGPILVSAPTTLRAIAYAANFSDSAIASAVYAFNSGTWYSAAWANRKAVTISHAQVAGTSNLANFPMLVSLPSDANLQAGARTDGSDILFTASDGVTKLNHEIEQYDSTTGKLIAWVRVPSLSPTADTVVYLYYSNPSASNQQNATGVWDSNYRAVWHLNGATLSVLDSTLNGDNFTNVNSVAAAAGQIGGAAQLSGSNHLDAPNITAFNGASQFSVSYWINPT
ncbi:MAG TPA: DUF2341 domain-containing protein, partial [Bryobacteraceae bacterium]|nr:DUF2341 domain-containing protein [Bryobacteraceae bacterium]